MCQITSSLVCSGSASRLLHLRFESPALMLDHRHFYSCNNNDPLDCEMCSCMKAAAHIHAVTEDFPLLPFLCDRKPLSWFQTRVYEWDPNFKFPNRIIGTAIISLIGLYTVQQEASHISSRNFCNVLRKPLM